ncbi:Triosephosphate isomerase [Candidatus Clavichlamydia salmonicola]|uniref:triose-phosphate isomerase n=1 Tax=Candidatus Clavichlamydia salmonicola TaxID=469812 RepID=UPI001891348E|nr:triose-phosphate isomerase [Candidatus Clavichlamydia salmonicola]MBF5050945.1 Triosephosphate isomerase [Candidatus Clavichlamydia salmonicola]
MEKSDYLADHPFTIIGNWKMHKTHKEAISFLETLSLLPLFCQARVFLAPPVIFLQEMSSIVQQKNMHVKLGTQNIYFEEEGAFTGEISVTMAYDVGANFTLVGHSERRQIFGETEDLISKKMQAAMKEDFFPVLCIGETAEERNQEKTEIVLEKQLIAALSTFKTPPYGVMIAYEPVWAIGTGVIPEAKEVNDTHLFCRTVLSKMFGDNFSFKTAILYGGSVNEENAEIFSKCLHINGLLVGGASLNPNILSKIVKICVEHGVTG